MLQMHFQLFAEQDKHKSETGTLARSCCSPQLMPRRLHADLLANLTF